MAIAISFDQLLAAPLSEEEGESGKQTLFQCVQCQGKASMSQALLCGRCFHCDATYYNPPDGHGDPPLPIEPIRETTPETLIHDRLELNALGVSDHHTSDFSQACRTRIPGPEPSPGRRESCGLL